MSETDAPSLLEAGFPESGVPGHCVSASWDDDGLPGCGPTCMRLRSIGRCCWMPCTATSTGCAN